MAYICANKVTHARLLPTESAHRFTYPTISFLLCLSALEKGELNLGGGWLFGYGGLWLRATGIRASAYLQNGRKFDDRRTIKQKLLEVLSTHSLDPSLFNDAWILTMPSYFGFEGINPLTVYVCYKTDQSLWAVVLEVSAPCTCTLGFSLAHSACRFTTPLVNGTFMSFLSVRKNRIQIHSWDTRTHGHFLVNSMCRRSTIALAFIRALSTPLHILQLVLGRTCLRQAKVLN